MQPVINRHAPLGDIINSTEAPERGAYGHWRAPRRGEQAVRTEEAREFPCIGQGLTPIDSRPMMQAKPLWLACLRWDGDCGTEGDSTTRRSLLQAIDALLSAAGLRVRGL